MKTSCELNGIMTVSELTKRIMNQNLNLHVKSSTPVLICGVGMVLVWLLVAAEFVVLDMK